MKTKIIILTGVLGLAAGLAVNASAQTPPIPSAQQTEPQNNVRKVVPWKQFSYTCEGGAKLTAYLRADLAKIHFHSIPT